MTREEKLELVKKHAPIFWLHERESFLPEDCKIVVEVSDLYRKGKRVDDDKQPQNLDDLGDIRNSEECYLKFRDLDMQEFTIPVAYEQTIPEVGPDAVGHLARIKYGYDFASNGIPTDNPSLPMYYARVSNVVISDHDRRDPFTRWALNNARGVFGSYTRIEYFFYFVFNDAWNKHQTDWDSTVHLYIKDDGRRTYMLTHMHGAKWLSQWPSSSPDLRSWLEKWNTLKKNELGRAYVLNGHPYIFVSEGAHGSYPTPGFTMHGLNLPGIIAGEDVIVTTDQRQIGRLCILPNGVNEDLIRTNLRVANIDANKIRFGRWKEPELVDKQPWRAYKGAWGEDTKYIGWDGPTRPPVTKRPDPKALKEALQFHEGYESRTVLKSRHVVR